jgi:type IV fimbrial biogenesis protein FimT
MSLHARPRGFTLTELMIVVAVMATLTAAALPSYNDFVRNQRVKTASFDLFSTLVYARSEAVTRNATVTITPIAAGWISGWKVESGGTLLRQQDALTGITFTTGPALVSYSGSGRLSAAAGPFELTATGSGITTRCVSIDLSGRPVTKEAAC